MLQFSEVNRTLASIKPEISLSAAKTAAQMCRFDKETLQLFDPFREGIKEFSVNLDLVKLGLKLPPAMLLIEK